MRAVYATEHSNFRNAKTWSPFSHEMSSTINPTIVLAECNECTDHHKPYTSICTTHERDYRPVPTFDIPVQDGFFILEIRSKCGSPNAFYRFIPAISGEMNAESSDWKHFIPTSDELSSVYEELDLSANKRDYDGKDEVAPVIDGFVYNVFDSLPADDGLTETEMELQ